MWTSGEHIALHTSVVNVMEALAPFMAHVDGEPSTVDVDKILALLRRREPMRARGLTMEVASGARQFLRGMGFGCR